MDIKNKGINKGLHEKTNEDNEKKTLFVMKKLKVIKKVKILVASVLSVYIIPVLLVVIPAVASIVFDFILERLFRRYMSPEDLEREEENDMYAS